MSLSTEANLAHVQRPVLCDTCEEEVPGTYHCIDCAKTFCEECEQFHNKLTKDHKVILRTQLPATDVTSLRCADHDKQTSFYCKECDTSVCGKCITGIHQGHKILDVNIVMEGKRKLLQCNLKMIEDGVLSNLYRQRDEIILEKEEYEEKIKKMVHDLEDENKSLHEKLDEIHRKRIKSLRTQTEEDLMKFDSQRDDKEKEIELNQRKVSEYESVLRKNSFAGVKELAERKECFPQLQVRDKPDKISPPLFVPAEIKEILDTLVTLQPFPPSFVVRRLDKITPKIISKFKSPLQGYPRIFITRECDVWLGGYNDRKLVKVDIKGRVLERRNIQNRPFGFAMMSNNDVIINPRRDDSRLITRVLSDGSEIPIYDSTSTGCNGMSVTADQKILISTCDGRVLRIDGEGTNMTEIYKGHGENSAIHAIEDTNGNIFINEWSIPAIVVADNEGKLLSTITKSEDGETVQEPSCLALDKMDNILFSDRTLDSIFIIDKTRRMRKLIGKSLGIKRLRYLAVDSDNNLWLTQRDGTIFVVNYLC